MVIMRFQTLLAVVFLASQGALTSPINEPNLAARSLTPEQCSAVVKIVKVLKSRKATPFCSSFLSITTKTVTSVTSTTSTSTVTTGTAPTSIVFLPGNPPAKIRRSERDPDSENEVQHPEGCAGPGIPPYLTAFPTVAVSSACSCLNLPTPTATMESTFTIFTTTTVAPPTSIKTVYPCASGGTAGYGKVSLGPNVGATSNSLYGSGTTGDSLEGCCNLCYFGAQYGVTNCIQAFYYSYQGCVVQTAVVTGSGVNVSPVCPSGIINGLSYAPDFSPPFRSTGDIAGPCGQAYTNF